MSQTAYKELVIRLQQDDKTAFSKIFWQHHAAIYKNVLRLVKDPTAAEDITQEVFTSLWEQRQQLNADKDLAGWLFTVSYYMSVDHLKQQQKERAVIFEMQQHESVSGEDTALINLQAGLLHSAIAQLSPQKRKVFEACKLNKKTYQQAADDLHLSKHTVKEYLSDANRFLKKYIRQFSNGVFALLLFVHLY